MHPRYFTITIIYITTDNELKELFCGLHDSYENVLRLYDIQCERFNSILLKSHLKQIKIMLIGYRDYTSAVIKSKII